MRSITIYDGLAGESVYKFYKSRYGIMWIATTNGVSSYDGYLTKTYRVGNLRSKNMTYDISQADDGYIWAATGDGLYKVDGTKQWMVKALPDIKGKVSSLIINGHDLYAGCDDGFYIGDTRDYHNEVRHIWLSNNHVTHNNTVNDILLEGDNVWLLSNYELYVYDLRKATLSSMNIRNKVRLSQTMRMMAKSGDRIFIGTFNDGVLEYNVSTHNIIRYLNFNCPVITSLSTDRDRLYVGTDGAGLNVVLLKDNSIIEKYDNTASSRYKLRDNTVYAFYHDPLGVNFFGYYRQGFSHNYYHNNLFKTYSFGDFTTEGKNIRSICIDGPVKLLGLRGGIWYIDEQRNIRKFFSPDELGGSIVTNVVEYAGQYYCCTFNGGVMRIDPKTLMTSRFGVSDALRTSSFGCLRVSPDDELWMSGNAGVYIYNAKTDTERHYDSKNSQLPNCYCNNMLFDRMGRCWISTAKGICVYDPSDESIHATGFPQGFFNDQHETQGALGDKDNLLFFSIDGLFKTNEELTEFGQVDNRFAPLKEYIQQVLYDKRRRNYWMATEVGMFRQDADMGSFRKFSTESGLNSKEFSNNAIYLDDKDILWTGTMDGLYYANVKDIDRYDAGNACIELDDIMFDRRLAEDKEMVAAVRQNTIQLPYNFGTKDLSFMPVLLNYSNQNGLCFEYRINDGEWQVQRINQRITIENLPLGQSALQIRLAGSKSVTEYKVYVFPSFLFILECIVIISVIVIIGFAWRQRRIVLRQQAEMLRVQQELEEAKKKYSRINVTENEQQRLYNRLADYMDNEKPYLSTDLKLSDVAAHLECSTVKLSQLFNVFMEKNYYDFINQYRLKEFKERINDKRYANYTLLALAEECGFKRSNFFATFKKVEGMTPTEYVKKFRG